MKILTSSAEHRFEALRHRLVLDLYMRRGVFWDTVHAIRTRWDVNASAALPPASPEGPYLPANSPLRPDWQEIQKDPTSEDAWGTYVERWDAELRDLHDAVIPDDCRLHRASEDRWSVFLSACVVFDPPVPGLEAFADVGAGRLGLDRYPDRRELTPDYLMQQSPIVHLRDAERAVRAAEDYYLGVISDLIEEYVGPAGHDPQRVFEDVLGSGTQEARARWDEWAKTEQENPARPFIEAGPSTTETDVRNAWRMAKTGHEGPAKLGRPRRGMLRDVECALLHDRDGWTYERIAEHYGWFDYTRVSKHVKGGREDLSG